MDNETSKKVDLEKRKEILINALLEITDGIGDEETENIFRNLYDDAIIVDKGDLVTEESKLTEHENYIINLAITAQNYIINSYSLYYCHTAKLIDYLQQLLLEQLSQLVPDFDFDLLSELSYAEYEKNKIKESIIAFSFFNLQCLIKFPENQHYPVDKLHLHGIRKTVEMLQENQCLVIRKVDNEYRIIGICSKANSQNCVKVRLDSSGEWTLLIPSNTHQGDTEIIKSKHRRFVIKKSLDIRRLFVMHKINEKIKKNDVFENIIKLIEHLINQKKGAAVVYVDDINYISKLIKHKRIFIISPIQIDLTLLKAFSNIDGAIIFNYQGQCLGYGAILDGEAYVDANLQRGSRYNSTKNFVELHERSFGIIVSDDGMVDIVSNA